MKNQATNNKRKRERVAATLCELEWRSGLYFIIITWETKLHRKDNYLLIYYINKRHLFVVIMLYFCRTFALPSNIVLLGTLLGTLLGVLVVDPQNARSRPLTVRIS